MSDSVVDPAFFAPFEEPTRRRVSARQAEMVRRLTVAAVDEVEAVGYDALTIRSVAKRAGVAPATAYHYFASKQHLLTEVFWRRLAALPPTEHPEGTTVASRASAALNDLALLVADEPRLAAACTAAMLTTDPDVKVLRDRIGAAMNARIASAFEGDDNAPALRVLQLTLQGALLQAGLGHRGYDRLPAQLIEAVTVVLSDRER